VNPNETLLGRLVESAIGREARDRLFQVVRLDPALLRAPGGDVTRAEAAMALNLLLMHDLLQRVPTGAAYVEDVRRDGGRVTFDHGALRTIRFDGEAGNGALPNGEAAFTRVFLPLGYRLADVYPLERLRMTGRAYVHQDLPEAIPQFFLSELHVERFSPAFQTSAERVFGTSRDPLDAQAIAFLQALEREERAPAAAAIAALPTLAGAFDRQHEEPTVEDYEALLAESAEAAWIATEGNAFNHVTDRVADVVALAEAQRGMGRPIKEAVEFSRSGRVRQTAFKADAVERRFRTRDGVVTRTVPGSFYEFITRDPAPDGGLDLQFDASNAQGIFKMTAAEA
jgi:hypothetical protein